METHKEDGINAVQLRGRLSVGPREIALPSGDRVLSLRLIVPRPEQARRGTATVDTIEVAVWRAGLQRSVRTWRADDIVEIEGAIRRRFFRGGAGTQSRVEVEMERGRVIRRAATAP
jgi:single-strand DNA-binding protein